MKNLKPICYLLSIHLIYLIAFYNSYPANSVVYDSLSINTIIIVFIKATISTLSTILIISVIIKYRFLLGLYFLFSLALFYIIFQYGLLNTGIVYSIIETNTTEALELLSTLDGRIGLLSLCLSTLNIIFSQRLIRALKHKQVVTLLFAYCFLSIIIFTKYDFNKLVRQDLNLSLYYLYSYVMQEDVIIQNNWGPIISNHNDNRVVVVVIGESERRDRLHMYGYSKKTTPSLTSLTGITLATNAKSPSSFTRESVPKILSYKNDINLNVIDLAKSAGYVVNWYSNQGKVDDSTLVASIGKRADEHVFLSSSWSNAQNDGKLFELAKNAIRVRNKSKSVVIFLHLIGSHPDFCVRAKGGEDLLQNQKYTDKYNQCYDQSILNTSKRLFSLRKYLENMSINYSITYFSDHGLSHSTGKPYLIHGGPDSKDVPFFILSSNKDVKVINEDILLSDFIHTYADLLSITDKRFNQEISLLQ